MFYMKTKIFVCSNSSIDYLPHNEMISSIPVILKVSDNEMYEDYIDVNIEDFYNRIIAKGDVTSGLVYNAKNK